LTTLQELHRQGAFLLRGAEQPGLESKILLLEASGLSELEFWREPGRRVPERIAARFRKLAARRKTGLPLAYLVGRKEFWSMELRVTPGVFIPRPETELLVELTVERAGRPKSFILDLGTGSGNIALALAAELPGAKILALDVSAKALAAARLNARRHRARRITFLRSSFFSAFSGAAGRRPGRRFDMIVSNPPYVSEKEWRRLNSGSRRHEPKRALVPGPTGLEAIRRIVRDSPGWLKPGGWLILEIGAGQRKDVLALFDRRWRDVHGHKDLGGLDRAVTARLAEPSCHFL
jgi:release factor glutamine methyltransferase